MRSCCLQLLLTALALTLPSAGRAQVEVTGVVMYKGKPVQDGYLYCDSTEAFTDSLGRFAITVDSLGSELYVGLLGYESMVYTVSRGGHHAIDLPGKYGKRSRRMRVCGFCFTADAQVSMGDGSCKAINGVRPGDQVLAWRDDTIGAALVLRVDSVIHDDLVRLLFSDGTELVCTDDHPIHVEGKGWCAVRPTKAQRELSVVPLVVGDVCLMHSEGATGPILLVAVSKATAPCMTYNLATAHGSYFANAILVSDEHSLQRRRIPQALP